MNIQVDTQIAQNTDDLIAMGKAEWLKKRKAQHKITMTKEQQEAMLVEIELQKENDHLDD